MEKLIEKILTALVNISMKLILALLIIIIGFKIANVIESSIRKKEKFNKLDESVKGFVANFVNIAIKCLLVIFAISILGVPTSSVIAVIGSCGVAIGLALQGGLSNIAGGLMILIFKPFKVGDYIVTGSAEGTVKNISMFYTNLVSADNKVVMIPNGGLTNTTIVNFTKAKKRRVDIDFKVSIDMKIEKVKNIIEKVISENNLILKDEKVIVRVKDYDGNNMIFTVRVWTNTDDAIDLRFDLLESIKESFEKNKIKFFSNQIDIYLKEKK